MNMRITDLEVKRYADHQPVAELAAGREVVVVSVHTEQGVTGLGFTNAPVVRGGSAGDLVAPLLRRHVRPVLLGENALLNELLWQRMYEALAARIGRRG